MKSKKILAAMLALTLVTSSMLVGCGEKKKTSEATNGANATKTETKLDQNQSFSYRITADPRTADISLNYEALGGYIIVSISEPLTRKTVDEKGNFKIAPGGAESWKVSDDGLTWTFKIREMKWSDDKPLSAKDYEYSLKRTINPDTAARYGGMFTMIKNATEANKKKAKLDEVGIKALDDRTLEIKLSQPCPYFLGLTSFYTFCPQRQDIVEKFGEKYGVEANTVISCGPFLFKEWVHNSKLVFTKNDKYWDAKNVKLQTLTIPVIKEENAALTQLANGDLDYADTVEKEWIEKLKKDPKLECKTESSATINYFILNQEAKINGVKLFSNKKIRQAILLAYDGKEVVDAVGKGLGVPAVGLVPAGIHIGDKEFRKEAPGPITKLRKENPDIKKLVAEGLKELGGDPDPSKYEISYLLGNNSAKTKESGEFYQQLMQTKTGFKMKLEFVESAVRTTRVAKQDYVMSGSGWNPDYDDPNTYLDLWITSNKTYPTGWNNAKYDELIAKAANELDSTKRLQYFKDAETLLIEEAAIVPTFANVRAKFMRKGVHGFVDLDMGGGKDFKNIYIEGRQK